MLSFLACSQAPEEDVSLPDIYQREDHFAANASEIEISELSKGNISKGNIFLLLMIMYNTNRKWMCNGRVL